MKVYALVAEVVAVMAVMAFLRVADPEKLEQEDAKETRVGWTERS